MANIQKCVAATEANNDALLAIISKALGYPQKGAHVGGGAHVNMPATWDGTGNTPPGWTKQPTANWVNTALDSAIPITDAMATALQQPGALANLSGAEQTVLSAALATRANKDLDGAAYSPKASAVSAGAAVADEKQPQGTP